MRKLGYGSDNRLAVKLSTRNVPGYRDAAVVAISQLREVYVDAELELVDTANYFPRIMRKDYKLASRLLPAASTTPTRNSTRTTSVAPIAT